MSIGSSAGEPMSMCRVGYGMSKIEGGAVVFNVVCSI